jgi:hypothetical protein
MPHVILTGGNEWDPRILDHTTSTNPDWYNVHQALDDGLMQTPFR